MNREQWLDAIKSEKRERDCANYMPTEEEIEEWKKRIRKQNERSKDINKSLGQRRVEVKFHKVPYKRRGGGVSQ